MNAEKGRFLRRCILRCKLNASFCQVSKDAIESIFGNVTYRCRRQWYEWQLFKKVARLSLHIESGLPRKTCVHLVRLQVYTALQLPLVCALYCVLFISSAMHTSALLSFSPKVAPTAKIYRFYRDCNKTFMTIR